MQLIDELKSYVGFDADDRATLQRLEPVVAPHLETVADRFLTSLENEPHVASALEHPDALESYRPAVREWLEELFGGVYDDGYGERRRQIGRTHAGAGLEPQHASASMNRIRVELIRLVVESETDVSVADAVGSLERILDIDLTLMLHGYWQALLSEKTDAGTELATRLAHEIRNPLNAIGLNLTLLERKLGSRLEASEPYTSSIEAIRTELQRVDHLTKEIKQYAQPVSTNAEWHDFEALLADLASAYGPTLEANDIDLAIDVQSAASDVYCDAEHLKRALVNLLENAVEAIDEEGSLQIEAGAKDGHTVVELTDSGEGIEPTATKRAFDLFYTTKASGTGIGLPMVKKIVQAHDGTVDVFRRAQGGTTVRLTFPRPTPPTEVN